MRKIKNGFKAVAGAVLVSASAAQAADSVVTHTWTFGASANPVASDSGAGSATVNPGNFASGWLEDLPALSGGAGGYWDLGQGGNVACAFANGLATNGTVKKITVRVAQWWDGSIFSDFATVSVPGAHSATTTVNVSNLGALGGWIVDETDWEPNSGSTVNNLLVTGGSKGTVLDSIVVEASFVAAQPQLSIQPLENGEFEITWPAAFSSMVLESTADVAGAQSWSPVNATVDVGETICKVVTSADGPARFYRLKQP